MNMLNGDEAMSPAEFAKLMGAYPQPAENPLPAYGGYMDNSPANFAWVNNNAYFGAEGEKKNCGCGQDPCITYGAESETVTTLPKDYIPTQKELDELFSAWENGELHFCDESINHDEENDLYVCDECGREGEDMVFIDTYVNNLNHSYRKNADTDLTPTNHMNNSIGQVVPITNPMELPTNLIETEAGGGPEGQITPDTFEAGTYLDVEPDDMDMLALNGRWWSNDGITEADLKAAGLTTKDDLKGTLEYMEMKEEMWGDSANDVATVILRKGWGAEETFEAPYGGAGALMDIGKDTPLADFTGKELAESSAIHGDFDQASLNYSKTLKLGQKMK